MARIQKKTKYYGVEFKVSVNKIIFDGVDSIKTQKIKKFKMQL